MIENTFIFNPVRADFLPKAVETLYEYTDMSNNRVVVVDQTRQGIDYRPKNPYAKVHLWLKPHRNLGFAKSHNEGIIHALHWNSKYITCANDDIEFIDERWWQGVLDTFKMGDNILAVNPESPRIPLWGYGRPHVEYVDLLKYKEEFTKQDYDYLLKGDFSNWDEQGELYSENPHLPETFPLQKSGVTDGVATWLTVFKREAFERVGLWDERFYPGGAEDHDMMGRIYRLECRALGTTKSWVWHWWGQAKDKQDEIDAEIDDSLRWADLDSLWPAEKNNGKKFDTWAHYEDEQGQRQPMYRVPRIGKVEI